MNICFSENLKSLRVQKGLTQESLADFIGVSFQAISKWERGENYPDIETLINIAQFFNTSVDNILGVNKIENEREISKLIYEYDNFYNDEEEMHKAIINLLNKYPTDFRVQLRYLGDLMFRKNGTDYKENLPEIKSIYKNIQENCTVDTIRICSKRYMAAYYNTLSHYEGSGISFDDAEKIIKEMPHMRDGQEFLFSYLYPHDTDEWLDYTMEAVEEEISLLCHGISHLFGGFIDDHISIDKRINGLECEINMLDGFYDDGNYGRSWRSIAYDYGHLGHLYFEKGDSDKALFNLKKAAELAKQFDEMDRITTMHSKFFEGREFDKHTLGSNYVASSRMKYLMTEKYPFSDEFKQSVAFKDILEILN